MARIRMVKVRGRKSNKPKVVYLHNNNFDKYTTKRGSKYTITLVGYKQKDRYINNQIKAYSAQVRFHTQRA